MRRAQSASRARTSPRPHRSGRARAWPAEGRSHRSSSRLCPRKPSQHLIRLEQDRSAAVAGDGIRIHGPGPFQHRPLAHPEQRGNLWGGDEGRLRHRARRPQGMSSKRPSRDCTPRTARLQSARHPDREWTGRPSGRPHKMHRGGAVRNLSGSRRGEPPSILRGIMLSPGASAGQRNTAPYRWCGSCCAEPKRNIERNTMLRC